MCLFHHCLFGKNEICWSLICFADSFSITYYILSSKIININQKKRTISTKHSGPIFCFKKYFKLFREFFRCLVIQRTAFLVAQLSVSTYHGQIFSPSVSQRCQSFLRLICILME